ncbi:3'(2'),5'-bisphosphate nucleotidase CysQ [uncultured Prochlorococcus sp.]|uniref:3'(2'),5'-bisphosphate nucleotidase CysQ n=1 Tax=uncultured Prochlorococcus sp. TaxID=159733 RepID=UPI0025908CFB|nr:3'(2'),5'-bisphosphate nucleotidase CysQ [uncultured Prochlorococcus sp.]
MVKIPFNLDIHNLIDDLRNFSWEASEILLYYSKLLRKEENKKIIIKTKGGEDPVTSADLKVNELIIKSLNEKYKEKNWSILSEENVKLNNDIYKNNFDWEWILDPLDGTKDFIEGTNDYALHLALNYKNKPHLGIVLIPEKNELWISDGKNLRCERRDGSLNQLLKPKNKSINEMTFVCSKNHRNKALERLIEKLNFKKVNFMGSIGCKIASIIRGDSDIYICLSLPGKSSPKDWDFAAPEAILSAYGGAITNLNNENLIYSQKNFVQEGIIIATNDKKTHGEKCKEIKKIIRKYNLFPIDS